ncbi:MAG: alpha/beta hydrolase domain-containing protein [Parahaliea sp.]
MAPISERPVLGGNRLALGLRISLGPPVEFASGMTFGPAGSYVRRTGVVKYAIDPAHAAYKGIVDLAHAPRNREGLVEFSADLDILAPLELKAGNGCLLYDVNNRGNKRVLKDFNDAPETESTGGGNDPVNVRDAGNGFLLREGYSIVWSGWQGDLLPGDHRLVARLPIARGGSGPIRGQVCSELSTDVPGLFCLPLSGNEYTASYTPRHLDTHRATLTFRKHQTDRREPIPPDEWAFATLGEDGITRACQRTIYLRRGFQPGWLYEVIYEARDPRIMGLGFTGVRDLVSYLRYAEHDDGGLSNPLRQGTFSLARAYASGMSQSGRFLREFIYRGFNEDCRGRRVFDAVMPHVAGAGRLALNLRFAQPGRYPRQHRDHLCPSDQFPFAYTSTLDPVSGLQDGLFQRPDTDPLVIQTQSSAEYWERRASLTHIDSSGKDLPSHEHARLYLFASAAHIPKPDDSPFPEAHVYAKNRLPTSALSRALLKALDAWSSAGIEPPPEQLPRCADGTALAHEALKGLFPPIPGARFPSSHNRLFLQCFGTGLESGRMDRLPPAEDFSREYTVLLPRVDADGLELAGIRTPDVSVPLATYTGWNLRPGGAAAGDQAGVMGGQFPLPGSAAERRASKDPRPSIEQRYGNHQEYLSRVRKAAEQLVREGYLLQEDCDRYIAAAKEEKRLFIPPP